jgi:uncharacterized RDD family membrane protein YckC
MSRVIKQDRAVELQGRRAGFASRVVADVIDLAIAFAIFVVIYSGFSILWDFFNSDTIQITVQSPGLNASGMWLTLVVYLSLGWASTGRTIGKQVMGLRVVRRDAQPLRTGQAIGRAVLCATFPVLMMVTVPFSRRNAGIHEMICKTVVVYDWIPATDTRHLPPPPPPPRRSRRRRPESVPVPSGEVVA